MVEKGSLNVCLGYVLRYTRRKSEYRRNKIRRFRCDLRGDPRVGKSYYQRYVTGMFSSFQFIRTKYKTNTTGVKSTSKETDKRNAPLS